MAFMGILAMWLGIIIIVLGTCMFFGCLFFIIALVMKLRAKKKPAVREDGTEYVKKWYWIPGTLSIISFVPVVLFIIFIAYAAIASSIENRQSLQYQVMNNNYKQAERLLKKGVSPDCTLESNEPAKDGEKTLLMIMAEQEGFVDYSGQPVDDVFTNDEKEMMKLLLSYGANIESVYYTHEKDYIEHTYDDDYAYYYYSDGCGRTPLLEAAAQGHYEVVQFLVSEGADINARDYTGYGVVETIADNLDDETGYDMLVYVVGQGARTDNITNLRQEAVFLAIRHNDRVTDKMREFLTQH